MNLIEIFGTTAFRLAVAFAGFFGAATLLLFAFIYWTTAIFETHRIDQLIISDAGILANEPTSLMLQLVTTRVTNDFHRVSYAGLFDQAGHRLAGNLPNIPDGLVADGQAYTVNVTPLGTSGPRTEKVRAVERHLANGTYLVIGRNSESLEQLQKVVLRALALGVIPAVALSLAAGAFLSWRTQKRVQQVHETAERIMLGHLRERLPTRGGRDEFDRLSISINHMLDEIERLLHELRATGDEIAHDLRTPLTRVRARLERGLTAGVGGQQLEIAVERAIVGLDSALGIVTALLRIREIEAGRRRLGFAGVDLGEIALAIEELYQPIAEEKQVSFEVDRQPVSQVRGDRDLLMEALGNLVDNGIKFTPAGGSVRLSVFESDGRPIVRIADTGPGIEMAERGVVFTRFYRSESSRNHEGSGLGLSLVAAIAKLHSIEIVMNDNNPGSIIELYFKNE